MYRLHIFNKLEVSRLDSTLSLFVIIFVLLHTLSKATIKPETGPVLLPAKAKELYQHLVPKTKALEEQVVYQMQSTVTFCDYDYELKLKLSCLVMTYIPAKDCSI